MSSPGRRLAGRYELLEPIRTGEVATAWRARDLKARRQVEVKILHPILADDASVRARLAERVERSKPIAHANLAKTLGGGEDDEVVFSVAQLVDGPTLDEALRRRGRFEPAEAVDIALAAASGIAAIHRRGLVHGEVTPGRIRLGSDGRVRVTDLDIAALDLLPADVAAGAVAARASDPGAERPARTPAGAGDDIHALGVVLYEMLTGRRSAIDTRGDDTGDPSIIELPRGIPPSLAAIVHRALAPDPTRRYGDARGFGQALERWAHSHPDARRNEDGRRIVPRLVPANATSADPHVEPGDASQDERRAGRGLREGRGPREWLGQREASSGGGGDANGGSLGGGGAAGGDPNGPALGGGGAVGGTALASATARPNAGRAIATPGSGERTQDVASATPLTRASVARERTRRREQADPRASTGRRNPRTATVLGVWVVVALLATGLLGLIVAGQLTANDAIPPATAPALGARPSPSADRGAAAVPASTPDPAVAPAAPTAASTLPPPSPGPVPPGSRAPTPPPVAAGSPAPVQAPSRLSAPAKSVWAFYDAAARHDWPTAISLWSPRMQEAYPPKEWLIDRFTATTAIKITDIRTRVVDTGAGTARVSISLIEYRNVEPSPRTFVGSWDLVRIDGLWLLDQPHF